MDWDSIGVFLFFAALGTSIYLRIRRARRKPIYITDYQCGLRYKDGVFETKVAPGNYRVNGSRDQIVVVDMRPRLVLLERIFYQDALQSPSVVSLSAELVVQDAYTASTRLKNATDDSSNLVRDAVRLTVSKSIVGHSNETRAVTALEIQNTANTELEKFGMRVSNLEITEAWSREVEPPMSLGAN